MPWMLRNRWARLGVLIQLILVLGLLTEPFKYMHYAAPVVALNYYFVQRAFQLTRWRNRKLGHFILRLTICLAIAALFVSVYHHTQRGDAANWHSRRAQLLKQLEQVEGQHLVIVGYGPRHLYHDEWVYNDADIDAAKVVFARAMDSAQDCELAKYFNHHRIWSLEVNADESIPKLKPYPPNLCR
jgi:hypothetical protein